MVVIEGPDGTGKTTLAKWIEAEFGLEYRRAPTLSSVTGPDEEVVEWFDDQIRNGEGGVYDRVFVISEPIYQLATVGRELMVGEVKFADMLLRFINRVQLLIFCLTPWEVAEQNLMDVGRLQLAGVDCNQLRKIHWAYEKEYVLYKEALFEQVTMYDYTNMSLDHIREAIHELVGASG